MRQISLTPDRVKQPTVYILNGGGQPPFNQFSRITHLLKKYPVNIVSIELPGHGSNGFADITDEDTMLDDFLQWFETIKQDHKPLGVIGYSLGGFLALQIAAWKNTPIRFCVAIGAPLTIDISHQQKMQYYASEEFFSLMDWSKVMLDYHKGNWQVLLQSIPNWLAVGSPLFVGDEQVLVQDQDLHLIMAEHEDIMDVEHHQHRLSISEQLYSYVIPSITHFEYFSKGWKETAEVIEKILQQYV